MQEKCNGNGFCLDFEEYQGIWFPEFACKFKCTPKNCNQKGCKQKEPEWVLRKNSGSCFECLLRNEKT